MTKEVLHTRDEDVKEKFEELTTEFEHFTEWLQGVLGDELKNDVQGDDGHWRRKPSSNHRPS